MSDHDTDAKHHVHYDLAGDAERAHRRITRLQEELDGLRAELADALGRIRDLERLRPTCVICLDATATQQTVSGTACSDCVGEPEDQS